MARRKQAAPGKADEEARRWKTLRDALAYALGEDRADRASGNLLAALGGMDGVFAASEEALREIPDVGPEGARLLRLILDTAQLYLEERSWNLRRVYDTPSAVELFRPKFLGRKTEAICLMLLDAQGRMVYNDLLCEGSFSEAPLYLRKVLRLCIEYQSSDVYLAHNHPSGLPLPSPNDLLATDRLLAALKGVDASLCDHVIFAGESFYSFKASGLLDRQRDIMLQAQREEALEVQKLGSRFFKAI